MAELILPKRFKGQPQYPAPVDLQGLGKGVAILLNPGCGLRDIAARKDWSLSGSAAIRAGALGKSLYLDQGDTSYAGLSSPDISGAAGTFAVFAARIGPSDSFGHVWLSTSTGNDKYYHIYNTETQIDWGVGGGSTAISLVGKVFNTTNTSLIFTTNGTGGSGKVFYLNGVATGTPDATAPPAFSSGPNSLVFGKYWGGTSWNVDADILFAVYLPGVFWGAAEARAFHSSRGLALFRAPARRLWLVPSTGINLVGATSAQGNAGSTGAITQSHALSGSNAAQANTASTGAITQAHALIGAASAQANTESTGGISQTHSLAVSACTEPNVATTGAATQTHALAAANVSQGNTAATGAISQGSVFIGAPCSGGNAAATGAITQGHALSGASSTQGNLASSPAISLGAVSNLTAAASSQGNVSATGAISQAHILVCAASVQDSVAAASAIVQAQVLAALNASQANTSESGAITIGNFSVTSIVERTAIFHQTVARSTKFQRSKSVTVRFN